MKKYKVPNILHISKKNEKWLISCLYTEKTVSTSTAPFPLSQNSLLWSQSAVENSSFTLPTKCLTREREREFLIQLLFLQIQRFLLLYFCIFWCYWTCNYKMTLDSSLLIYVDAFNFLSQYISKYQIIVYLKKKSEI